MNLKRINHPLTYIIAAALVIGIAGAFWYLSRETVPLPQPAETSPMAYDFSLPATDGTAVRLSDFRGKVVLISLWQPDCESCDDEIQALVRLHKVYTPRLAVIVIAVNTDAKTARDQLAPMEPDFPVLIADETIAANYPGEVMPRSYLIDQEGRLRAAVLKHPRSPYDYFQRLVMFIIAS
ncbi:MAG TPA: TlpA disulfide reductase family protein [Planctomycetota bacterium]|nr:TlpA disulfide reductase family protein [Planctomycetota bacterium]